MPSVDPKYDVCVVGAGSGGIGAALAAARGGLRVALVERSARIGGSAVHGGVHNWEPGVGGSAFPREIYERLYANGAAGVWSYGRHCCWPGGEGYPGGETLIDDQLAYDDTLRRHGGRGLADDEDFCRKHWHGVIFEPDAYADVVESLLAETNRCTLLASWSMVRVRQANGTVPSLTVQSDQGEIKNISASYFVDATADVNLCQALGCDTMLGQDSADEFREPGAPASACPSAVNAVTLIYRATPTDIDRTEPPDSAYAECPWQRIWPFAAIGRYPCGDLNVNMLPTMNGGEFLGYLSNPGGYAAAYDECRRRVRGHWNWLQRTYSEFRKYRLSWVAPSLGVRETKRIRGEYILTQHDLISGLSRQSHSDIIAVADHAMDTHGAGGRCGELAEPYGIPFRCLLPLGLDNVAVACRGAAFSHIAASSCRLSRTMMDLGHAAGAAIALAARSCIPLRDIDVGDLRRELRRDGASI